MKAKCEKTCGVCNGKVVKRTLFDNLSRKIREKSWKGGRSYVGELNRKGQPHGTGVYTVGTGA